MNKKILNVSINILKGLLVCYIVTIVFILIFSALLTYTKVKENSIPMLNTITMISSISLGAIYSTIKIKEKGWLHGGIVGILYYVVLLILNYTFAKPFTMDIYSMSKLLISLGAGVIGGMIGINLK
ncbi:MULTISPECIES: TIGR04086 family membrane protein [Tissierellales]|uniref:TIGR04086 family membrane protein n=1 Tax=Acidilutibacter cellobiosedens TaxID=2507161 RepID=A0A410QBR4_9FIRM|nr:MULTISPECIES: TIGR04086 family membrane protein [Tissierellales]MBE6083330.1 TIGR04086 family membrane protein [Tissierellaceae bacterium]QAT61390.1 TIGR04086 family membrane protein [Acidilutibacter cellobiosedens]SCL95654.1 putative membrane protein [Sporanaerobacter sp. PP17-6a]